MSGKSVNDYFAFCFLSGLDQAHLFLPIGLNDHPVPLHQPAHEVTRDLDSGKFRSVANATKHFQSVNKVPLYLQTYLNAKRSLKNFI